MLCPLMGGDIPQMERFQKSFKIIYQSRNVIENPDKLDAVLFAMANKFLNEAEFNQIKEELKMTELGLFLYNDGKADAAFEIAKNAFMNGGSFDFVRKSIQNISDEKLQEIYDEVMASKDK